jgi:aspartate-semialdehyde dehydrogenase
MPVLKAIRDEAGLEHVTVSTYQSVSGTGQKAITALQDETRRSLAGEAPEATVYAAPIAFNVVPLAGSFSGDDGYTDEELKLVNETRKILELPDLPVSATCVRVPVVTSHSEAVWVETTEALGPDGLRAILRETPGIRVVDAPGVAEVPTALDAAGNDDVWVGRIRRDLGRSNGLAFWVVSDNLRKGAATNAVDIAHTLVRDGLLAGAGR